MVYKLDIVSVLFIALALAMDTFSVSVTSGIILKKAKISSCTKIGIFFGGFQFLMPCAGYFLASLFSEFITAFDHWIAFVLLAFIGAKMLWEAVKNEEDEEIKNPLDNKLLLMLAIATSIDALAVGVTFATMGMSVAAGTGFAALSLMASAGIIGAVAFILSFAGVEIGAKCGNLFGNKAEILGGIVLIGIGVKILIEHLFF